MVASCQGHLLLSVVFHQFPIHLQEPYAFMAWHGRELWATSVQRWRQQQRTTVSPSVILDTRGVSLLRADWWPTTSPTCDISLYPRKMSVQQWSSSHSKGLDSSCPCVSDCWSSESRDYLSRTTTAQTPKRASAQHQRATILSRTSLGIRWERSGGRGEAISTPTRRISHFRVTARYNQNHIRRDTQLSIPIVSCHGTNSMYLSLDQDHCHYTWSCATSVFRVSISCSTSDD